MSETDPLSALASDLMRNHPNVYANLVVSKGTPAEAHRLLDGVTPDLLLAVPIKSHPATAAMLAALWLWHDGLEECHRIVQKSPQELQSAAANSRRNPLAVIDEPSAESAADSDTDPQKLRELTATLALWHAIMHRREGDFSNSKYWYDRAGEHPIYATLVQHAGPIVNPLPADKMMLKILADGWNAAAFVDLVEYVNRRPGDSRKGAAVELQRLEWRTLFAYCTREARG